MLVKYRKALVDDSWRVEVYYSGEWRVAFYCQDEASADHCLDRCLIRDMEWARMTEEERRKAILR